MRTLHVPETIPMLRSSWQPSRLQRNTKTAVGRREPKNKGISDKKLKKLAPAREWLVRKLTEGVPRGTEHSTWLGRQLVDMSNPVNSNCAAFLQGSNVKKLLMKHTEHLQREV